MKKIAKIIFFLIVVSFSKTLFAQDNKKQSSNVKPKSTVVQKDVVEESVDTPQPAQDNTTKNGGKTRMAIKEQGTPKRDKMSTAPSDVLEPSLTDPTKLLIRPDSLQPEPVTPQ
jgi:hypothetical protein